MGQENQKIQFQGHLNENRHSRKRIFDNNQHKQPAEICQIPGCNCHLTHQEVHAKVCQSCFEAPPPFLKTKTKPKYYEQNYTLKSPSESTYIQKSYKEPDFAQALPRRLLYYNAWSLPIQKYQIRDKQPYKHDDRSDRSGIVESIIGNQSSGNSQSMDKPIYFPQTIRKFPPQIPKQYMGRRKQNLNLAD